MKKMLKNSILIFGLLGFLISCGDKEEAQKEIVLTVDSTDYVIDKAAFENYGEDLFPGSGWDHDGINIDLSIGGENIIFTDVTSGELEISGSGPLIYFELFSSSSTELAPGDYVYNDESPFPTGSYDFMDVEIDYSDESGNSIEAKSGTLNVNKVGEEFELTFNGILTNDSPIYFYYKGTVSKFDYTNSNGRKIKADK